MCGSGMVSCRSEDGRGLVRGGWEWWMIEKGEEQDGIKAVWNEPMQVFEWSCNAIM